MTFNKRLALSLPFEKHIIERLNDNDMGHKSAPFGQGLLSEDGRDILANAKDAYGKPLLLRWMPDIITRRYRPTVGVDIVLIDAKVCNGPRYAIEISALEAAEIYESAFNTPWFFVFDDWGVLTPSDVRQHGFPGPNRGNGSGTPYLLVERCHGRPFTDVFPTKAGTAWRHVAQHGVPTDF